MSDDDDIGKRVHMVSGTDERGDVHLFATNDVGGAEKQFQEWQPTLSKVRRNFDWTQV